MNKRRVLIYGESPEAHAILEAERAKGHHASLRRSDRDAFEQDAVEHCDDVHCWDNYIWHRYEGLADIYFHGEKRGDAGGSSDASAKPKSKSLKRAAKKS